MEVTNRDPEDGVDAPVMRYFGDYELLEELARGGMGIVYRARQVPLNRKVALKVLAAGPLASPEFVVRFRTETEVSATLDHPNIVPIYEVGSVAGQAFFSMRLIGGGTLAEQMRRTGPLPGQEAARLVSTLARAVHYAHQRGVLHRDLKPGNVLLDSRAGPMLTDFGLAKLVEVESTVTQTEALLGTPAYMSPEQAAGKSRELTTAVDVYGLGAILYELLTGQPPFAGGTTLETVRQVLDTEPRRPSKVVPGVPPDLEVIALKCLEKQPQRRYGSAEALADDLDRWLRHEPILARPASNWEHTVKWVQRHPRRTALLVVTAAALLAAAIIPSLLNLRLREANARTAELAEESRQRLVRLNLARGIDRMDQGDLAGSLPWLVNALRLDQGHPEKEQVHRIRLGTVIRQLPRLSHLLVPSVPMASVGWSPDEDRVLMISPKTEQVEVWSLSTGQPLEGFPLKVPRLDRAAFNHRGDRFVTTTIDGRSRIWNAHTGQPVTSPIQHPGESPAAVFSPDDLQMATVSSTEGLSLWDARDGRWLRRLEGSKDVTLPTFSSDGRWLAGARGSRIVIWETAGDSPGTELDPKFLASHGNIQSLSFNESGTRLAAQTGFGIAVLDVSSGALLTPVLTHQGYWIFGCGWTPDQRAMLSWSREGLARFWGLEEPQATLPYLRHDHSVETASLSPDGLRAITGSKDQTARIWDVSTGTLLAQLHHTAPVKKVSFSRDGGNVLTFDGTTTRIWALAHDALAGPTLNVNAPQGLGFSASGRQILTVDSELNTRAWDVSRGEEIPLSAIDAGSAPPRMADHSWVNRIPHPDGIRELMISDGAVIRDAATQRKLTVHMRHREEISGATFSRDGRLLATTGFDRRARVWDVATGDPVTPLLGGRSWLHRVEFSPDGLRLAVGGNGPGVDTWNLEPEARPLAALEQLSQLMSGRRLRESGDLEEISPPELLTQYRNLAVSAAAELESRTDQLIRWQWREVFLLEGKARTNLLLRLLDPEANELFRPWRARLLANLGARDEALHCYTASLSRNPEAAFLWRERSRVARELGDLTEARHDAGRAVDLEPKNALHWTERARANLAMGDAESAIRDLDVALTLSPHNATTLDLRAEASVRRHDWAGAAADFAAARILRRPLVNPILESSRDPLPPRSPEASPDLIDLGNCFTGPLTPGWFWQVHDDPAIRQSVKPGLPALPVGVIPFGGISFEIRGVAQLAGQTTTRSRIIFPRSLQGIGVSGRARKVHFLHATDSLGKTGDRVGEIVIHYADGTTDTLTLRFGMELGCLMSPTPMSPTSTNSAVAWSHETSGRHPHQALYRTTWSNPHPERPLALIDYRAAFEASGLGPMLFAITVEP